MPRFLQNMAKLALLLEENNITVLTTEAVTNADRPDEQIQSLKVIILLLPHPSSPPRAARGVTWGFSEIFQARGC